MKKTILFISIFLLMVACKNDTVTAKQQLIVPNITKAPVKETKNVQALKKDQLKNFFPDYIGSHKQFNIFAYPAESVASASYGSFDNSYTYSLSDGINNSSVIENFELSYNSELNGPEGTKYIKQVRDGYKTIAFLQPNINRYNIEFIYNNRFKLILEGPENPDVLWTYIKEEDLKKLAEY